MLGRSKLLMNRRACSSCSRSMMSARVSASAVAVSAMRGTPGERWCSTVSARYSGRKSWPHWLTQCASSIANRLSWRCWYSPSSRPRKRGVFSRSGAAYSSVMAPVCNCRSTSTLSSHPFPELKKPPPPLRRLREALGGVQEGRIAARLVQRTDLVVHQRNQRRDHDAHPAPLLLAHDGRHLVAQRLAAPGGHQHQRVATG